MLNLTESQIRYLALLSDDLAVEVYCALLTEEAQRREHTAWKKFRRQGR